MSKLTGQFRSTSWDPILNVSQIVALQACFYLSLAAIVALMNILVGSSRSLDHLFKYQVSLFIINKITSTNGVFNEIFSVLGAASSRCERKINNRRICSKCIIRVSKTNTAKRSLKSKPP